MPLPEDDFYARYLRPAATTGGALVGGLLGAAAGAPAGMPVLTGSLGSALGSSIALEAERAVRRALGDQTVGLDYSEPVGDVLRGMVWDYLTQKVGGGLLHAGIDLAKRAKHGLSGLAMGGLWQRALDRMGLAGAEYRLDLGKRYDVPLTPAEVTGSPKLAKLESVLRETTVDPDEIITLQSYQHRRYTDAARDAFGLNAPQEPTEVGRQVLNSVRASSRRVSGELADLYADVAGLIDDSAPVGLNATNAEASKLLEEVMSLPDSFANRQLAKKLKELAVLSDLNYTGARRLISELGDLARRQDPAWVAGHPGYRGMSTAEGRIYKRLRSALAQDLDAFLETQSPAVVEQFRHAKSEYEAFKKLYNSDTFRQLLQKDPEKVMGFLFGLQGPEPNHTRVELVKRAVDPDTWNTMKTYFLDKYLLKTDARDLLPVNHLSKQLAAYGDSFLSKMFNPREMETLHELADLGQALFTAQKIQGNPSGTGRIITTFLQGYDAIRHPISNITYRMGRKALAALYFSEHGRDILRDLIRYQKRALERPSDAVQQALERAIIRLFAFAGADMIPEGDNAE